MTSHGSITGFYTAFVEGDDMDEPIADASRAILDGLGVVATFGFSRHYPPIDVMKALVE